MDTSYTVWRYSPSYYCSPGNSPSRGGYSPPRQGYSPPMRGYSPPRQGYGNHGRHKEQKNRSLLVRNIPLDCRPEELQVLFERFGVVRDVYIPKDYYTRETRAFAFVHFVAPDDTSEAQSHMNGKIFLGRVKCCRCKRGNGLSICKGKAGLENCQDMEVDGRLIFVSFQSDIAFPFIACCTIVELKMPW